MFARVVATTRVASRIGSHYLVSTYDPPARSRTCTCNYTPSLRWPHRRLRTSSTSSLTYPRKSATGYGTTASRAASPPSSNPLWAEGRYEDRNALQQCWPSRASKQLEARAPPFVAAVCREAREVAFRWGGLEATRSTSLECAWVQTALDTVLYGWLMSDSDRGDRGVDRSADFFEAQRRDHPGVPIALLANLFCQFAGGESEMGPGPGAYLRVSENDTTTYLLHNGRRTTQQGEARDFSGAVDADAVMEIIYIHARKYDILASGLFGFIADEPSQLVDCDDAAHIAKYRALFDMNFKNQRRWALTRRFDTVQSPAFLRQVDRWLAITRWRLLMRKWLFDKEHSPDSAIFDDPAQVFEANTYENPGDGIIGMGTDQRKTNRFDVNHPWVAQERAALPKIRPKIWFAYCTRNCEIRSEDELVDLLGPNPGYTYHFCNISA
ncbi:hypothetical protein NLG97_g4754 [Lecanicillium saksenae]|uniref:Uncharacterized protein n=1 Tax=Lecanicillium saksenae TaxID=468837 RepID=A0ACC1QYB3_9HYPO|nr:hypothetical protein NLG97_g4754 [Lecanicillium saksenae]